MNVVGQAVSFVIALALLIAFWSTFGGAGNTIIAVFCVGMFFYWVVTDRN